MSGTKKKWWLRHPVLEAVVSTTAAVAAWAPPLSDPKIALVIGVIGILFSVGRYGLDELLSEYWNTQLTQRFSKVDRLAEIVDLEYRNDLPEVKNLIELYSGITDPEFFDIKQEILLSTIHRLSQIHQDRRTATLSTGAYYEFLLGLLDSIKVGETIHAVSTGEAIEWDDSPEEERFFTANKEIVSRGGRVVRFFVYDKAAFLAAKTSNKKVEAHFSGTGLEGNFVDKDRLKATDPYLYKAIGQGFILVEQRIAVVDIFGLEPRGYITKNRDELKRFSTAVNQLRQLADPSP
jgi:hypothetical protein